MIARFNRTAMAILAGVAASPFVAMPAAAQDEQVVVRGLPEGTKMRMVPFRDLNLRRIADLNILNERVERAVRDVCDFESRRDRLTETESYTRCANAAWAGAHPQVHRAYLRANRLAVR
jgi:UrcA family protein